MCSKDLSLVFDSSVQNGTDRLAFRSSGLSVSLYVSPLTFLLSLGWLTRGCREEDWQDLLRHSAGENFREFVGSQVCPECFPSADANDQDKDDDDEEDEEEDDEEYSDEIPVTGLLIRADGRCEQVSVASVEDIREILGCSSVDYNYDREFAVWIYRSEHQSPKSKVNVYVTSIANSFIPDDCVVLYDLDKEGNRVDHWTDLGSHWFEKVLHQMIERCNNDVDSVKFLEKHRT